MMRPMALAKRQDQSLAQDIEASIVKLAWRHLLTFFPHQDGPSMKMKKRCSPSNGHMLESRRYMTHVLRELTLPHS